MKSIVALVGFLAGAAVAQFPPGFPSCGVTCVNNMLGLAGSLGCSNTDAPCLCRNPNFGYGVRDCSVQACQNDTAAQEVINFGIAYCSSAGVAVPTESVNPTGTGGSGGSGGAGGSGASSVPVTTSEILSTIVSGGSTLTSTVGSTTLFSVVGGGAGGSATPISTSTFTSVITSNGSTFTSTGESTIFGSGSESSSGAVSTSSFATTITSGGSTITSSGASTVTPRMSGSGTGTGSTSSSSTGLAPQKTAAPAGLLAAAGIAAFLL